MSLQASKCEIATGLYLAWTDRNEEKSLNLFSTTNGVNFENKITLPETSCAAPALVEFGERLYLAWTGTDESHSLNLISSADGVNFENKITLPET
ncbi:hypothetical protein, partial [Laspinema olomoucense]